MVNKNMLMGIATMRGLSGERLANHLDIAIPTFYRKVNGVSEFKVSEVQALCGLLQLTDEQVRDIFFASEVS